MQQLSSRIRSLRRYQQRTQKDVADMCGCTVSLISKIESGQTNPPLATLSKIAGALNVKLGDLLAEKQQEFTAVTPARKLTADHLATTNKGYSYHLLGAQRIEKVMQPFLFVAERGKVMPGPMSHSGEEFIYVIEGRMRYRVGDTSYELGQGDSLYFNAEEDHDLEPLTAIVRYLGIFTERPPSAVPLSARTQKIPKERNRTQK